MLKQKSKKNKLNIKFLAIALVLGFGLLANTAYTTIVHADRFDDQIKALQQENSDNQAQSSQLAAQASSYQDAIGKLQTQITSIQAAIDANQKQSDDTQKEIEKQQADLDHQKVVLGKNIKAMYLQGDTSTLEMLASSTDLSDFVNQEEYRSQVQDKVKDTVNKITALKQELQKKQQELQDLIKAQQAQRTQLSSAQSQQNELLAYTEGQKAAYDQQIKTNKSKIGDLRAQQAAENAKLFAGANIVLGSACDTANGDTYPSPWCSSGQDSMIDSWGMFNRECVSYTAWKVAESGRYMPYWGGIGNANQWDDNARAAGIPTDLSPRAGDVAIKNSQPYGHAMYVESVNGNGTMNISQYNANLDGRFSRVYNMSPAGLVFIHF